MPTAKPKPKKQKLRILHVVSEVAPFCGTGGLAEVSGSLPAALAQKGADVRVMLPYYRAVQEAYKDQVEYVCNVTVPLAWRQQYCGVFKLVYEGVTYYFLDNEYYFHREGLYGFYDDAERFAFFARAALEALPAIGFVPDILHAHDWQAALVGVYYRAKYQQRPEYSRIKTVFTLHNIEYQGKFDPAIMGDVLDLYGWEGGLVEYDRCANFAKGGIICSDRMTTVSPTYAHEIGYDYFAHGLAPIIQSNAHKTSGILNGINTRAYDPASDAALAAPYSALDLCGKEENKTALQDMLGLNQNPNVPMVAMVSRLVPHKGFDLVAYVMEELLQEDVQVVILGKGERRFEEYFQFLSAQYPGKIAALITYNSDLAHKIYAGADIFLMPSKSEPCGLAQMIACRYGTVPVVRNTGGLADSIRDYNDGGEGFLFDSYNAHDMLGALRRALGLYRREPLLWHQLCKRIMGLDFSWAKSAGEYYELYRRMCQRLCQGCDTKTGYTV